MATSYLSPGVYVEEVDRGSKPIEAVGTNTVGFLGESTKGPLNEAVLITNWSQFVKTFGDFTQSDHLAHAVYGFFNNGGSRCFVVNVGAPASLEIEPAGGRRRRRRRKARRSRTAKPAEKTGGGNTRRPLHRQGRRSRRAHRPQVLRRDRRDRDRRRPGPDLAGRAGRDALALRDPQGSLRDPRFAGDDRRAASTSCPGRATRSTARTTSRGSRSTIRRRATSSFRRRATSPASTRASTASAASTRRPANEIVRGALGLKYNVSKGEQDLLNPKGINGIRFMNGGDPHLGRPHALDRSVVALHQRPPPVHHGRDVDRARDPVGRLRAQRPSPVEARAADDLLVPHAAVAQRRAHGRARRSRRSTSSATRRPTRPRSIDAGQLVVEIGLAPVKPAEFVIFRIGQMAGRRRRRRVSGRSEAVGLRNRGPLLDGFFKHGGENGRLRTSGLYGRLEYRGKLERQPGAGWVQSAEGGSATRDVVNEKLGPDHIVNASTSPA